MKRILRFVSSPLLAFVLVIAFLTGLVGLTACPGVGPVIGSSVIDCTKQNQDQLSGLLNELSPLITTGKPDWSAVYVRARNAGTAIGGCVLAQLVQGYLGNRGAPHSTSERGEAADVMDKFRREVARGATFHVQLPDGTTGDL